MVARHSSWPSKKLIVTADSLLGKGDSDDAIVLYMMVASRNPDVAAFCMATPASAQFYFPMEQPLPNLTNVTNEGVAVGYNDQNCPFYIWDAVNGTMKLIGGISAGQGVGGNPSFPDNGKCVAAPMQSDKINVYTSWIQADFADMAPYTISQMCYMSDYNLYAIGNKPDGSGGFVFKSTNNGLSWEKGMEFFEQGEDGKWYPVDPDFAINCIAAHNNGMVWRKQNAEKISAYTAGLYDIEADTWTPLISTGYIFDSSASSPWRISGDGNHVVGLVPDFKADLNKIVECAAVWDGIDNVTPLDNRRAADGRACRANAVSYDGSVVVGWQDVWGPWYASIWRKGDDGAYKQTILTAGDKTQDEIISARR